MQRSPKILFEFVKIDSSEQFFDLLDKIQQVTITEPIVPYLHFEFHGCKEGLEISGKLIPWESLKTPLLKINRATHNNLFISVASCYGAFIFKILSFKEPCPFFGFIGPDSEIYADELEINFSAFFESLLKKNSFDAAIESLNKTIASSGCNMKYSFTSCHGLFDMKVAEFTKNTSTASQRNLLINQAITFVKTNSPESRQSINDIRTTAKRMLRTNSVIEKLRKIFLHEGSL